MERRVNQTSADAAAVEKAELVREGVNTAWAWSTWRWTETPGRKKTRGLGSSRAAVRDSGK